MKTILLLVLSVLPALTSVAAPPQALGVSFGVFYSSLEPYGEWIELEPQYFVWHPLNTAPQWRPYFYGNWSWTPDGWYWVSDEPWAWATYHYGRWYFDDYYGWVWMPGYDWAPAWVEWRYSNAVIGWAPLGPYAVFRIGFGIHYSRSWVTPHSYWCFVDVRHMGGPRLHRYIHDRHYNSGYLGHTHSIDGARYEGHRIINRGPDRGFIEQRGGNRIREAQIVDVRDRSEQRVVRGGEREEIRVYRPNVDRRTAGSDITRPGRVREADRKTRVDIGRTDLEKQTVERQGRQPGDVRVRQGSQAPAPGAQQPAPGRVVPRQQPRVQQAPEVRSREQGTRRTQPSEGRREVQPSKERRQQLQGQPAARQMNVRERPAQVSQRMPQANRAERVRSAAPRAPERRAEVNRENRRERRAR
jgi:hypothetical protein